MGTLELLEAAADRAIDAARWLVLGAVALELVAHVYRGGFFGGYRDGYRDGYRTERDHPLRAVAAEEGLA